MAIDVLLKEIDSWFNDPGLSNGKAKLLSKLAILELCGWLEQRLDELANGSAAVCMVENEQRFIDALERTYGFDYHDHFRKIIVHVIGERGVIAAETALETSHPGELELLKSSLGDLKKIRGILAHTTIVSNLPRQVTLQAPSWAINQHRVISKRIDRYESALQQVSAQIQGAL